jgi:intraflagellar transport protein 46
MQEVRTSSPLQKKSNSAIIENDFFDEAHDLSSFGEKEEKNNSEDEVSSSSTVISDYSPSRFSKNESKLIAMMPGHHSLDETYHSRVVKNLPTNCSEHCCDESTGKGVTMLGTSSKTQLEDEGNTALKKNLSTAQEYFPGDQKKLGLPSTYNWPSTKEEDSLSSLFDLMNQYKPKHNDLKTELKCFIPSYIPAIGMPDSFVKIPRPDSVSDGLGFLVIDEPAINQSNEFVLENKLNETMTMQLKKGFRDKIVKGIKNASKNIHEIDDWITTMKEQYRSRHAPEVLYQSAMPDASEIMKIFHPDFYSALEDESFSDALNPDLDLTLYEYACLIFVLFDIPFSAAPVCDTPEMENMIYHLHFLFNLYLEYNEQRLNNNSFSML